LSFGSLVPHARAPVQLCLPYVFPPRAGHGTRHRVSGFSPPWLCCEAARVYSSEKGGTAVGGKAKRNREIQAASISIKAPRAS